MDYIRHIPVEAWSLEEQDQQIEQALKSIELVRVSLYKSLTQYRQWEEFAKDNPNLNKMGLNIEIKEYSDKVKITIPNILPYVRLDHKLNDKDYYRKLNTFYVGEMTKIIQEKNIKLTFSNAFILIKQYFPDLKIRDFDNQIKSFIFNALRYSKLIKDDSWKNLTYMEAGELCRTHPRTEIIVTDIQKMGDMLKLID
ncbi:hypothetical protein NST63_26595 [Heyndrickxia sp. FSL W8-0496]|uniref:hypothetical protein n=1 Tax=Heyndrickxia TaxID=2837504 RepID=UPI00071745D3